MQNCSIEIGDFEVSEADHLGGIFFDAVREGTAEFYDFEQRRAWASKPPSGPNWASRLAGQKTVVARKAGLPVGFMTLDGDGYIDLAFVAPGHQRQGIGEALYARIESTARDADIDRLHSKASYFARGLFEQQGWEVVRMRQIERSGVTLTNFLMEKRLDNPVQHTDLQLIQSKAEVQARIRKIRLARIADRHSSKILHNAGRAEIVKLRCRSRRRSQCPVCAYLDGTGFGSKGNSPNQAAVRLNSAPCPKAVSSDPVN